jgi:hypothetical protein
MPAAERASFDLPRIARAFVLETSGRSLVNPDGTFSRLAIEAIDGLDEHELAVLDALRAYHGFMQQVGGARAPARRARQLRRLLRTATAAQQRAVERLRSVQAMLTGTTRPLDPLTDLCSALRENGLMPAEIVELLDAAGLETRPKNGGAHAVQSRIDRARKRMARKN